MDGDEGYRRREAPSGDRPAFRWRAADPTGTGTGSPARGLGQRRRALAGESRSGGPLDLRAAPLRPEAPTRPREENHRLRRHRARQRRPCRARWQEHHLLSGARHRAPVRRSRPDTSPLKWPRAPVKSCAGSSADQRPQWACRRRAVSHRSAHLAELPVSPPKKSPEGRRMPGASPSEPQRPTPHAMSASGVVYRAPRLRRPGETP